MSKMYQSWGRHSEGEGACPQPFIYSVALQLCHPPFPSVLSHPTIHLPHLWSLTSQVTQQAGGQHELVQGTSAGGGYILGKRSQRCPPTDLGSVQG